MSITPTIDAYHVYVGGIKNIAIGNVKVQNTKIHKVHIILSLLIHSVDQCVELVDDEALPDFPVGGGVILALLQDHGLHVGDGVAGEVEMGSCRLAEVAASYITQMFFEPVIELSACLSNILNVFACRLCDCIQ